MNIRELKRTDKKLLREFLLSLSPTTLLFWNRFGTKINRKKAEKIAKQQMLMDKKKERGFVAVINNKVVGYAYLRFFPDKPQKKFTASLGIVVSDKYQGMGIGKKLMEHLINFSKKIGLKKIWLATYFDNIRALHIYKKYGFEVEGIFMYDEFFGKTPKHVVSMALFLDKSIKRKSKRERKKLINQVENLP